MTRYPSLRLRIFLFNLVDQKKRKKGEGRQKAHRPTPEGWPVTKTSAVWFCSVSNAGGIGWLCRLKLFSSPFPDHCTKIRHFVWKVISSEKK